MKSLSVVIQAGGQSSRMGQDKALMPFLESTFIEYILKQVEGLGDETIIITNNEKNYPDLGVPMYPDRIKGIGALGGIYSALYHANYDWIVLLACDMPFINLSLLEFQMTLTDKVDLVVPKISDKGFVEPFRGLYRKDGCLTAVKRAIDRGERRVVSFFTDVRVRYVDKEEINLYDKEGITFMNVNTIEDIQRAEKTARNLDE